MHNRYVHILESGENMVSSTVIASITIQLVLSILVPIIAFVYFRKNIILIESSRRRCSYFYWVYSNSGDTVPPIYARKSGNRSNFRKSICLRTLWRSNRWYF